MLIALSYATVLKFVLKVENKMKQRNPWKKILMNAVGAQKGWNTWHQSKGVNRPVKVFTCTEEEIGRAHV